MFIEKYFSRNRKCRRSVLFAAILAIIFSWPFAPPGNGNEIPSAGETSDVPEDVPWITSMNEAISLAGKMKQPMLVHFYSPTCGPCMVMERDVFADRNVLTEVQKYYIPVKINIREEPASMRKYGIQSVPTDVIVSSDGKLIAKNIGGKNKDKFLSFTNSTAGRMRFAVRPESESCVEAEPVLSAPETVPGVLTASEDHQEVNVPAVSAAEESLPEGFVLREEDPFPIPVSAEPANTKKSSSLVMLDGYCAVTLVEQGKWLRGDPKYGVSHRGQIYLFVSDESAEKFFVNPDFYAVAGGGYDVVSLMDHREYEPGVREFGLRYDNVNFLFSSAETREIFSRNPEKYMVPFRIEILSTARAEAENR